MTSEQDCKSIRRQAIMIFCHDFGAIIGTLAGYSDILNRIAKKEPLFDDIDRYDLLQMVQDYQQHSISRFTSAIDLIRPYSENCEASVNDIIEEANTVFYDDFKIWCLYLKQLVVQFENTEQLDAGLTALLVNHASNLNNFRLSLLDEIA